MVLTNSFTKNSVIKYHIILADTFNCNPEYIIDLMQILFLF